MATTTHPDFNEKTEALEVAKAFAAVIRGKTVLVTGVNRAGIGYTTAEAFVCSTSLPGWLGSPRADPVIGFSVSCPSHPGWSQRRKDPGEHRALEDRVSHGRFSAS